MTARVCVALIWPENNDAWRAALPKCDGTMDTFDDTVPASMTPATYANVRAMALRLAARPILKMDLKEDFFIRTAPPLKHKIIWEEHKAEMRLMVLAMELVRQNQKKVAAE